MSWLKKIFASFSSKERRLFIISSALSAAAGITLIWLFFISITTTAPAKGGDYTEGFLGQPSYVNPLLAENSADKALVRLTFANLPDLADKIESDATGKIYRVRLKENLLWSDGEKLTSDDVIFTLQRLQDPQTASPYRSNWQGVSAGRVSELEIQFTLSSPYAFFPQSLANFYVAPKHIFADTPPSNWKLSDYNLRPVGSGPYVFYSYEKRDDGFITTYHLRPNENYFSDKPYIENFDLRFYTKADDLVRAFNAGSVDAIADIGPETLKSIHRTYDLTEYSLPNYYAVFWNQAQNQALQDASVREALALAADRSSIIRDALYGYGREAFGPIPAGIPDLDINYPSTKTDLTAAQNLLDSAGWKTGDDGIRAKVNKSGSTKLEITLTVPEIPFLVTTANALSAQWQKIGVKTNLQILSPEDILSGPVKNRNYEAILFGNLLGPNGDLYSFWHSSEKYAPGLNLALFGDKQVDKLLESIRQNTSATSRALEFQDVVSEINSASPALFLYSPSHLFVYSKDLSGVKGGFLGDGADRLREAKNWYIRVARVFK